MVFPICLRNGPHGLELGQLEKTAERQSSHRKTHRKGQGKKRDSGIPYFPLNALNDLCYYLYISHPNSPPKPQLVAPGFGPNSARLTLLHIQEVGWIHQLRGGRKGAALHQL